MNIKKKKKKKRKRKRKRERKEYNYLKVEFVLGFKHVLGI
jgi:hypothetical protein